jgi:2',3'-cyclic-nucleotide 2'-phosphodiesterase (5'-nucleotidase family)
LPIHTKNLLFTTHNLMLKFLNKTITLVLIPALCGFLNACSPKLHFTKTEKTLYIIDQKLPLDSLLLTFYKPYKLKLDSVMNDIVAVSDIEITKNQPEGLLNNFFADALYQSAKAANISFDIAFTNYGGLRLPLPKGNIYRYKIFELMPFENRLVTVKFDGAATQKFFDYMASKGGEPISGATYTISNQKATNIFINNKPFAITQSYTVLTSDYMANGGDKGAVFYLGKDKKEHQLLLRTAILQYLEKQKKAGKNLNPILDERVKTK